jgi:hypothetical protein
VPPTPIGAYEFVIGAAIMVAGWVTVLTVAVRTVAGCVVVVVIVALTIGAVNLRVAGVRRVSSDSR